MGKPEKLLTPKQLALVAELVASPGDSVEDCAKRAGYNPTAAYETIKRPHVRKAIEAGIADRTKYLMRTTLAVQRALAHRGIKGETDAARTYLQSVGAIGSGGSTTHVNVSNTQGREEETFNDRLRGIQRRRARALAGVDEPGTEDEE